MRYFFFFLYNLLFDGTLMFEHCITLCVHINQNQQLTMNINGNIHK